MDQSAEMIENRTEAKGGQCNTPEPDHAVEEVLLKVIIFFPIDRPRNHKAGKDEKNDNIILPVLRTQSTDMAAKEPIKIGMAKKDRDGCGKP